LIPLLLTRLSTLLRRGALGGCFVAAMVMLAGLAREAGVREAGVREAGVREGVSEESVHAASEFVGASLMAPVGGAGDDDGETDLPLGAAAVTPPLVLPHLFTARPPYHAAIPRAPERAHPAARGPPRHA
jgi:hypothetical protein